MLNRGVRRDRGGTERTIKLPLEADRGIGSQECSHEVAAAQVDGGGLVEIPDGVGAAVAAREPTADFVAIAPVDAGATHVDQNVAGVDVVVDLDLLHLVVVKDRRRRHVEGGEAIAVFGIDIEDQRPRLPARNGDAVVGRKLAQGERTLLQLCQHGAGFGAQRVVDADRGPAVALVEVDIAVVVQLALGLVEGLHRIAWPDEHATGVDVERVAIGHAARDLHAGAGRREATLVEL